MLAMSCVLRQDEDLTRSNIPEEPHSDCPGGRGRACVWHRLQTWLEDLWLLKNKDTSEVNQEHI